MSEGPTNHKSLTFLSGHNYHPATTIPIVPYLQVQSAEDIEYRMDKIQHLQQEKNVPYIYLQNSHSILKRPLELSFLETFSFAYNPLHSISKIIYYTLAQETVFSTDKVRFLSCLNSRAFSIREIPVSIHPVFCIGRLEKTQIRCIFLLPKAGGVLRSDPFRAAASGNNFYSVEVLSCQSGKTSKKSC